MRTFIVKLAAWHRLYTELDHARVRLAQAESAQLSDERAEGIEADVRRLQGECDQALGELQAAAQAYMAAER